MSSNFSIQFILSITLQQNKGNCLTVNMNENKTEVVTQIIPRYTSEYCCNLDNNIPQVRTNRGTGLEMLLGLNRVILNSELGGDGYIRCAYQ